MESSDPKARVFLIEFFKEIYNHKFLALIYLVLPTIHLSGYTAISKETFAALYLISWLGFGVNLVFTSMSNSAYDSLSDAYDKSYELNTKLFGLLNSVAEDQDGRHIDV